jgi:hypothetical protein
MCKSIVFSILFCINCTLILSQQPVSYYFSVKGDDENTGTSVDNPWKSLDKLNGITLNPGDNVLLKRGEIFYGSLNLTANGTLEKNIVVSSYGEGELPVISGAVPVSGWENTGDGMYRASFTSAEIKNVFLNNKQLTIARFPNSGYLNIDKNNGDKGFTSNEIAESGQKWNGATVVFRTNNWTWENREAINLIPGVFVFDKPSANECRDNWGFYITNSLQALDLVYEWCHDFDAGYLYLKLPESMDPNDVNIEGATRDNGIIISGQFCTIENIQIEKTVESSITSNCSYLTIDNCLLSKSRYHGLKLRLGGDNNRISNCKISDVCGLGIDVGARDATIENCTLQNIGLYPELSLTGQQKQIAIKSIGSRNTHVYSCVIDSIGYSGILTLSDSSMIENNIITNTMMRLNDGGALYSYGQFARYGVFRNNIIKYVHGYGGATESGEPEIYPGMYLDNGTRNMLVENNTVAYGGGGIHGNAGTSDIIIRNNISFGNTGSQFSMADWGTHELISGYFIENNTWVSTMVNYFPFRYICYKDVCIVEDRAVFNGNYYINPFNSNQAFPGNRSFEQWKSEVDTAAVKSYFTQEPGEEPKTELITNSTSSEKVVILNGVYVDLDNQPIEEVLLAPYTSTVVVALEKDPSYLEKLPQDGYGLKIFPNPAKSGEEIHIHFINETGMKYLVEIMDVTGRKLVEKEIRETEKKLDGQLKSGIYFIKVLSENRIISGTLIIGE